MSFKGKCDGKGGNRGGKKDDVSAVLPDRKDRRGWGKG